MINVSEMCQKWYFWQISNSFPNKALTVFWHIFKIWHISDTFPNLFWWSSDRYLCLTVFWLISDTFMTLFWHIFVTDSFLTVIWHISDWYLTEFCNWLFSDRFLTDIWQISKSFGTNLKEEYQTFVLWQNYHTMSNALKASNPRLTVMWRWIDYMHW